MAITKDTLCTLTRLTGQQVDAVMAYTNYLYDDHQLHYDCYDLESDLYDLKVYHTELHHREAIARIVLDN